MLFILTRELWQKVRHCASTKDKKYPDIWYALPADSGTATALHCHQETASLEAVLRRAENGPREPVKILVACEEVSEWFEHVLCHLAEQPVDMRLSVIVTSCLDEAGLQRSRGLLQDQPAVFERLSSFFVAGERDSEFEPLDHAMVSASFSEFLQLLCEGRESLADALGIFRNPGSGTVDEGEGNDGLMDGERRSIVFSGLGIRSWMPKRERIVNLTQDLLRRQVVLEKERAAREGRFRGFGPAAVVGKAMALGDEDEPLAPRHFEERIPPPPPCPYEDWRIPYARRRVRQGRHEVYREMEREFTDHVVALETTFSEIQNEIRRRAEASFEDASKTCRRDIFREIDLGGLDLLASDYFPAFDPSGQTSESPPSAPAWLPDRSQDCFCDVYEVLDDELARLPKARMWAGAFGIFLGFLAAAWFLREAPMGIPIGLAIAGAAAPAGLWVFRLLKIRGLRKRVVHLCDRVYRRLHRDYENAIRWVLSDTRFKLERRVRTDVTEFLEGVHREFESFPWLFAAENRRGDDVGTEISRLRQSLLASGIDEAKLDRLIERLELLARKIVESAQSDNEERGSLTEMLDAWIDDFVRTAAFPLEASNGARDEILETACGWRTPALLAPVTDAEMHRGYRKVVALPDSDLAFEYVDEEIPAFSGNPMVSLKSWSGPVSGVAVCSVMTGIPEAVFTPRSRTGNGVAP